MCLRRDSNDKDLLILKTYRKTRNRKSSLSRHDVNDGRNAIMAMFIALRIMDGTFTYKQIFDLDFTNGTKKRPLQF